MTRAELDQLPEYSLSLPTFELHEGKLIGCKKWKRKTVDGWAIGEAVLDGQEVLITWTAWVEPPAELRRLRKANGVAMSHVQDLIKDMAGKLRERARDGSLLGEQIDTEEDDAAIVAAYYMGIMDSNEAHRKSMAVLEAL